VCVVVVGVRYSFCVCDSVLCVIVVLCVMFWVCVIVVVCKVVSVCSCRCVSVSFLMVAAFQRQLWRSIDTVAVEGNFCELKANLQIFSMCA